MFLTAAFTNPVRVCIETRKTDASFQIQRSNFCNRRKVTDVRISPQVRRTNINPSTRTWACASSNVLSLTDMETSVADAVELARESIKSATDKKSLDDLRVSLLGKKGSITAVMKSIGKLNPEDRPKVGVIVKEAKAEVETLLTQRKTELEEEELKAYEDEWIDVLMPGIKPRPTTGRIHPLTSTIEIATEIFRDIGYDVIDDPEYNREIETDYYCFDALNCPPDHPARDMQDTFYLKRDKSLLLRTQTSSVQIRYMQQNRPPFKIIAPGRVFRRDAVDATHSPVFHQIEILALDKKGILSLGSLRATIIHFLKKMLGDEIETRFRASYFPFTEPSMEVDVFFRGKWLEVLGCGMVDPDVLKAVGLDPDEWTGFAAGFGVERFAMVMHEISDIREFYRNEPRFLSQFMISIDNVFPERYRPTKEIDSSSQYAYIADEEDRVVGDEFDYDESGGDGESDSSKDGDSDSEGDEDEDEDDYGVIFDESDRQEWM